MNIFALDNNPQKCAEYHSNFHIAKMSEKYLVMLEKYMLDNDSEYFFGIKKISGLNVYNPKVQDWLEESENNVIWFASLILEVYKEFHRRYKRHHVMHARANLYVKLLIDAFEIKGIEYNKDKHTTFKKIMPDCYNTFEDPIDCYRYYYFHSKTHQLKYNVGEIPAWMGDSKYTSKQNGFEVDSKLSKMVAKYKDRAVGSDEKETILNFIKREADAQGVHVDVILYQTYEKRKDYIFRYSNKMEDDLFSSLVRSVFGDIPIFYGDANNRRQQTWKLELTEQEYLKFNKLYEFHRSKLKAEYKRLMASIGVAYISKQNIVNRPDLDFDYAGEYDKKGNKVVSKSDEDFDAWTALNLSNSMDKHDFIEGIEYEG